jgi:phycocyanin beta chain
MFDAYSKVVSQADARGDFLSMDQMDALSAVVDGNKRIDC